MALDLGAGTTILFKNSGLEFIDTLVPVLSFGNSISADNKKIKNNFYKIGTIQTNAFKLTNAVLPAVSNFQSAVCDQMSGVWGADTFDGKIISLNMQDSTLAIFDSLPILKNWTRIESDYKYPHFYVYVKLGERRIKLLFDTGSASSIVLSEAYFNENFSDDDPIFFQIRKYYGTTFISASGAITDSSKTLLCKNAYWDIHKLSPISITVSGKIKRNVLGMNVFQQFNILLDYYNHEIYIQSNPNYYSAKENYFARMGFNIRYLNNNKLTVAVLQVNSPAEKSGLKIGDQILSINSIIANESNNCEVEKLLKELDGSINNNEIVVKRGNETLKLTL
ncbi:MAG: PDZ domain-containing protein [Candidatus Saccharimonadaceae bacterium]